MNGRLPKESLNRYPHPKKLKALTLMKKLLVLLFFTVAISAAQEVGPFADEVAAIQKKYDTLWDSSKETIVFTGSSSIRKWLDVQKRFPDHQIINSGFGGSQASDLLRNTKELILRFMPKKVFIYEGDNDISSGRSTKEIIEDFTAIISKIRTQDATTEIVLISAKPSIARWNLKRHYKRLNRKLRKLSRSDVQMNYADVWKPMLNGNKLKEDLFLEDGLHMKPKGYDIWYRVLKDFVEAP